jgi:hypothetical protein
VLGKAKSTLPPGLSVNEDIGQAAILPEVERLFHIRYIDFRFVALDGLADIVYLKNNRSIESMRHAGDVAKVLKVVSKRSFPDAVEYVTVIGQRQHSLPTVPQPGLEAVTASTVCYLSCQHPSPDALCVHGRLRGGSYPAKRGECSIIRG